jgi:hypothetical protein
MPITSRRIVGAAIPTPGREDKLLALGPDDPRVIKLKRVAGRGKLIASKRKEIIFIRFARQELSKPRRCPPTLRISSKTHLTVVTSSSLGFSY